METRSVGNSNLAIFNTFKTRRNKLTGEAIRQRGIITHLAMEYNPEIKTRTAIAHAIAKKHGIMWQNIYSGIFRDLDEVLVPLSIVKEEGRLPLRRGPRALQKEGVPHYGLSKIGLIVASVLEELGDSRIKLLERYIGTLSGNEPTQKLFSEGILLLLKVSPSFVFKIMNLYVTSYIQGTVTNLVPIDVEVMQTVVAKVIGVEKELVEAVMSISYSEQDVIRRFINMISQERVTSS